VACTRPMRGARVAGLLALLLIALTAPGAPADRDRVPELCASVTTDPSYKVRVSAALVLGKLRDKRGVAALRKALGDEHYAVRATAAQALGAIGDPQAVPALERAAEDPNDFVRTRAKQALQLLRSHSQSGAPSAAPAEPKVAAATRTGRERFYVGVGGMGDKSRRAGPELTKRMREFVVRELQRTPDVTLELGGGMQKKKLKGFTLEGAITEMKRAQSREYVEISCEVSYVIGVYPTRSIVMMTSGGATIQTPRGQFRQTQERRLQVDALENAVKGAHQNLLSFLKAQR
jgi:HEAT repeat protein